MAEGENSDYEAPEAPPEKIKEESTPQIEEEEFALKENEDADKESEDHVSSSGSRGEENLSDEVALFEPQLPPIFKDDKSIFPSYTKLVDQRHRSVVGKMREKMKNYKKVFKKDLEEQYLMSKSALDGVRMARCFMMGIHIPKKFPDPLTPIQRSRVENILKYNIS